jgi:hypothetical protein
MIDRSGRSIMAVVGNANQALEPDEVIDRAKAALPECSHLFIGGCFKMIKLLPAFEQLADEARKQGVLVVLDHARLHDRVSEEQKIRSKKSGTTSRYFIYQVKMNLRNCGMLNRLKRLAF